jgi:hypothetical protein
MDSKSPLRPMSSRRTSTGVQLMMLSFRVMSLINLGILSIVPQIGMLLRAGQATGSSHMLSSQAMT